MKKSNRHLFIYLIMAIVTVLTSVAFFGCSKNESKNEEPIYNLQYRAEVGGYIAGNKTQKVLRGQNGDEITAVADNEYEFVKWSDGVPDAVRRDFCVQSDLDVTAIFTPFKYEVRYCAEEGGYIEGVTTQIIDYYSETQEVTAVPYDGYVFKEWSDGLTTDKRIDFHIRESVIKTAVFRKKELSVRYFAGECGKIVGQDFQSIIYGESGTEVRAVPLIGYKFEKWSDTGSNDPVRRDVNIEDDISANAIFVYARSDGRGTMENPVLIETYEQLTEMRTSPDLHYKLTADLDLNGIQHKPIFCDKPFIGVFDGDHHAITNVYLDNDAEFRTDVPSLFGNVAGYIFNLNINDFEIDISEHIADDLIYVGSVVGRNFGTIKNVNVKGDIHVHGNVFDGMAIGGLVGSNSGTISNCSANVKINIDRDDGVNQNSYSFNIGGMIGVNYSGEVLKCNVAGEINSLAENKNVIMGGLIGYSLNNKSRSIIQYCNSCVNINHSSNSKARSGGAVAIAHVLDGELFIADCKFRGTISGGENAGGLIDGIHIYGISDVVIMDITVTCTIKAKIGGGLIYWAYADENSNFKIYDCEVIADITAPFGAGLCWLSCNAEIYRCYSRVQMQVGGLSAGFVTQMNGGIIRECFAEGKITVQIQASGFVFIVMNAEIKDSYSNCDITVTNTDPNKGTRTIACGFAAVVSNTKLINCYSAGKISGHCYTVDATSGAISLVGAFAGQINNTEIDNCSVIRYDDSFAVEDIVVKQTLQKDPDLMRFNSDEINGLLERLNRNSDNMWTYGENGLPVLIFFDNLETPVLI